jgi:hypothetical protein
MSKQILVRANRNRDNQHERWARFLALFLGLFTLLGSTILPTSAQRPAQGNDATGAAARNAALIAATNDVLKETSQIRQLPILRPVQSSAQSRAEIERMVINNLDRNTTPAQIHALEVTLKKLGLAPADFEFRALMIRLLTEQVAGYYDPKTQQFHLADWINIDGQKPIMAHELTHALQDQHFNLRRFEHWPRGDSDAELAAHALIEGDATLVMSHYVANNPLRALEFLKSLGTTGMATEELDKAPRALRESLLFSYQEGLGWTRTVYRYHGWKGVSDGFRTLPQSTEQILHPEKYFVHEAPVKVELFDIERLLNTGKRLSTAHRSLPTDRWRRVDFDVNGEWNFYLILDQFLKSSVESHQAAAGWGGDRYAVYENRKGDVMYISLSAWDTERDAREFFDAYVKRTELRYPEGQIVSSSPDSRFLQTSEGAAIVEMRGMRILVLEGLTNARTQRAIVNALWGE